MANIFKRFTEVVNKPNRATYDLSFQNNLTMKFGTLYPVFCKEVLPGDSFRIKPTFGFNFMPLVSPVQTRMRAHLHFFYVRNRPHWKDFMDWDGMTKDGLTPPYIKLTETNRDMFTTGQIGDFFGIPTKVFGQTPYSAQLDAENYGIYQNGAFDNTKYAVLLRTFLDSLDSMDYDYLQTNVVGQPLTDYVQTQDNDNDDDNNVASYSYGAQVAGKVLNGGIFYDDFNASSMLKVIVDFNYTGSGSWMSQGKTYIFIVNSVGNIVAVDRVDEVRSGNSFKSSFEILVDAEKFPENDLYGVMFFNSFNAPTSDWNAVVNIADGTDSALDNSNLPLEQLPFASTANEDGLRINAFPFRAYEAIYNSFYRDDRNNPRIVNGQPEYNKFITTDEGGADTTHYQLYNRNWEPDFLTTAVQSPQQGVAPLVGITSVSAVGDITLTDSQGNEYTAKTTLADDDDTIVGINITSGNGTSSVNRALVDMASTGISISDLRNVNALQRWLEINMRRGLRYREQVKSHYGVDLEYKELNMPEFIGGVSEDVIVNRISQTAETENNPLGALAGQAGVIGTSKHDISHYCDEKGFIIGILSIAPVPNYSQLLPKHMLKTSQLDYFTPEFAHIGMQPILYSEVTPMQAHFEGKLNDVFGYQRPWYDYLASVDEVHGQFRDTLRRYLINRVFDGTPELGSEFLTIDAEQLNDVFAVTDNTDKIYGQVYFDVTAKRPIAANVTPRIEP